jgi:hypothetical protein
VARFAALLVSTAWLLSSLPVSGAAPASAPALPLRVELGAAVECASAEDFLRAVQGRSARVRSAEAGERSALVEVELVRQSSGMRGSLRLRLEDGAVTTRSVTGDSCEAVVEALSLTTALALESAQVEPESPSAEAAPPPAPESAMQPIASTPGTAPHGSSHIRFRSELGVQAAVARVVAPHLNVGGALAGRIRLERAGVFSPTLGASLLHTDNGLFESSRHAAMRLSGAALSLCPLRLRASQRWVLEPCAAVLGGRLQAEGRELLEARSVSRSWWGAGMLARGAFVVLSGLEVGAEAGVLLLLVERDFVALSGSSASTASLGHTPAAAPFANLGIFYAL